MSTSRKRPKSAHTLPQRPVCDCGSGLTDLETIPSSGGVRACERCYSKKHRAYAYTAGLAEPSDDPSAGSGWHYSRNPPQQYTITEGGRRARLAGGNVFFSKTEAHDAARFLRRTEGGDYRVRALKPGEGVGRVAVANGRRQAIRNGAPIEWRKVGRDYVADTALGVVTVSEYRYARGYNHEDVGFEWVAVLKRPSPYGPRYDGPRPSSTLTAKPTLSDAKRMAEWHLSRMVAVR